MVTGLEPNFRQLDPASLHRQRLRIGQDVDRDLKRKRAQGNHFVTGMTVANLMQYLPRIGICLGSNVTRIVLVTPIERATIEAVTRGAHRLIDPGPLRRRAARRTVGRDRRVGVMLPGGRKQGVAVRPC